VFELSLHRVTISGTYFGQIVQNVPYFHQSDGTLTPAEIATEVYDHFLGHTSLTGYQHMVSSFVTFFQIKVEQVTTSPPQAYTLAINRSGGVSGSTEANPVTCLVMQMRAGVAGRHGRGRLYIPGTNPAFLSNGLLSSGGNDYVTQCMPAIAARYTTFGSSHGPLDLVIHKKGGGASDYLLVEQLQISTKPGCQRRRAVGVGI